MYFHATAVQQTSHTIYFNGTFSLRSIHLFLFIILWFSSAMTNREANHSDKSQTMIHLDLLSGQKSWYRVMISGHSCSIKETV